MTLEELEQLVDSKYEEEKIEEVEEIFKTTMLTIINNCNDIDNLDAYVSYYAEMAGYGEALSILEDLLEALLSKKCISIEQYRYYHSLAPANRWL